MAQTHLAFALNVEEDNLLKRKLCREYCNLISVQTLLDTADLTFSCKTKRIVAKNNKKNKKYKKMEKIKNVTTTTFYFFSFSDAIC